MSEMVERVARRLLESNGYLWENASEGTREEFEADARAAIAELREPTEAMIRACDWPNTDRNSSLEDVWRVMIDAALAK